MLGYASFAANGDDSLIMPSELIQQAEKAGCVQVSDFYDRPAIERPVFVFGQIGAAGEYIAAFWCELGGNRAPRAFRLVVAPPNESTAPTSCLAALDWWNYPGGLSIEPLSKFGMDGYLGISEHKPTAVSSDVKMNVIVSEYDGITTVFVCDRGSWKYKIYH